MNLSEWKTTLARILALAGLACGIAAVVLPFFEGRVWKIGYAGWFAGGALLVVLAIFLVLDELAESRRR